MTRLSLSFAFVFAAALASLAVACGPDQDDAPSFGADPDYASIAARVASPTGSLTASNAADLFTRYDAAKTASAEADLASGAPDTVVGVRSEVLALLDVAETGRATSLACPALSHGDAVGSCGCPAGGDFAWDFSGVRAVESASAGADASLHVKLDACGVADVVLDGREDARLHADAHAAASDQPLAPGRSMIVVTSITVTPKGGAAQPIDLAGSVSIGASPTSEDAALSMSVEDGFVTIAAGPSADVSIVTDARGAWTCATSTRSCVGPGAASFAY